MTVSLALVLAMIVMFFAYFQPLNESFAHASVAAGELPDALRRWGALHRVRTVLSFAALAASLASLVS
jgi:hypothetical protein